MFFKQEKHPEKQSISLDEKFNGAYSIILDHARKDMRSLLNHNRGKVLFNIPFGVGLIDVNMARKDKFDLNFRYRTITNNFDTLEYRDQRYSELERILYGPRNVFQNGYIHNEFFSDIRDHLPKFYETFVNLVDEPNDDGKLAEGDWSLYYGPVVFSMMREKKNWTSRFSESDTMTGNSIEIINQEQNGWGGGGMHKKVFSFRGQEYQVEQWTERLDKYFDKF